MNSISKPLLAAALFAGSSLIAVAPASAQMVKGLAVANPTAVVALSNAYKVAEQQRHEPV